MEKDYLKDITEIRSMMEKSSKFISLSGLSGILAGIYALVGAYFAYEVAYTTIDDVVYGQQIVRNAKANAQSLLLIALGVLALTVITGLILTKIKAKKEGVKSWDDTTKNLLTNLAIPLVTGAIVTYILYINGIIGLIAPFTLIFYGLGLINASHFTYRDIKYLGISEIILGLIACFIVGKGLIIWAIGFGALHIVYGSLMYFKYER